MNFSQNLLLLRKENKLSAKKLSELIDYSTSIIYDWEKERAQPNIETLIALSKIFNVSVGFLIGAEDEFGAVNVAGEELSKDEKELLRSYRALDFDSQNVIRIQLKALVESKA